MDAKKLAVRLLPLKAGTPMDDGTTQPAKPSTRTRGLALSQFLSNSLPELMTVT